MDTHMRRRALTILWILALTAVSVKGAHGEGENQQATAPRLPDGCTVKAGAKTDPRTHLPMEILCSADGSEMVLVPGGEFTIGADMQEVPRFLPDGRRAPSPGGRLRMHKVNLAPFFIDKFEVTNAQFAAFMKAGGYSNRDLWSQDGWNSVQRLTKRQPYAWENPDFAGPRKPVAGVSYFEAEAYAKWVGRRLPSEAEWEAAARGVDHRKYPWGNDPPAQGAKETLRCNFGCPGDGFPFTAPVGSFPLGRSPFGCEDMAGNLWEWCANWHDDEHPESAPPRPPTPDERKDCRPLRGGSWNTGEWDIVVDARHWINRWYQAEAVGLRTALSASRAAPARGAPEPKP